MTTDSYDRGELNRQTILDLLHERGPMCLTDIAILTGASVATMHKRIQRMVDLGEIANDGNPRPKYSAIAIKTQSADIDRENQRASFERHNEARRKRMEKQSGPATRIVGNRIVHVCSDHLPTPKGAGGGQCRSNPSRACSSLVFNL